MLLYGIDLMSLASLGMGSVEMCSLEGIEAYRRHSGQEYCCLTFMLVANFCSSLTSEQIGNLIRF